MHITSLSTGPERPMNDGKGVARSLVGPHIGAHAVDVHLNIIKSEAGPAPYHYHEHAENVYIVLEGVAEAIVDGKTYRLGPHDVAFIPPGTPHAAGSAGLGPVTMLEIYAPAGTDFHLLVHPDDMQTATDSVQER